MLKGKKKISKKPKKRENGGKVIDTKSVIPEIVEPLGGPSELKSEIDSELGAELGAELGLELSPELSPSLDPSEDPSFERSIETSLKSSSEDLFGSDGDSLSDAQQIQPFVSHKNKSVSTGALAHQDPVMIYLSEIRKYPLLSREDEVLWARKYFETKDPKAAQILVTANLRFVVKVAAEYSRFGAKMIDLIQEGNMGLMHAVREFNPHKGVRLITYAVWWIRGYIQEYLMKQYSLVKIGTTQAQKKLFYQLQKQKEVLESLGESADIKLLSTRLGVAEDEVQLMTQRMSGRDISLDQPLDEESKTRLQDLQSTDDAPLDEQLAHQEQLAILKEKIDELRPLLSEKERIILEDRLLADEPLTLQEIGDRDGTTREAVRQMEERVLKKIRLHFFSGGE